MLEYEKVKCNLCGSDDYKIIYESSPQPDDKDRLTTMFAASSAEKGGERLVECRKCGLAYVNPRLKPEYILRGYSDADNAVYAQEAAQRMDTFREGVRLIEQFAKSGKGSILDIGCAAGFFLAAARESGWQVYGVEPSKWFRDYARDNLNLQIKQGEFKEGLFAESFFDVITFWDVLEHTPEPSEQLRIANKLLKKGGLLLINYPAFDSVWSKIFKTNWWFFLSVHLFYFTKKSMKAMLQKNGFEPLSFRLHWQKLSLSYLISRVKPYSVSLYKLMDVVARKLGLQNVQIKYYASQVNVIARKI